MRTFNRTPVAILLSLAMAAAGGCSRAPRSPAPGGVVVGVGLLPYRWLVEQIGGDRVEVVTLVKPGDSAELYQPTDAEVSRLMQAAVYFRTGMPFERGPWLDALQANPRIELVDLRAGIELRPMESHAHGEAAVGPAVPAGPRGSSAAGGAGPTPSAADDPHVWLSPRLLKTQARTVAETLQSLDPDHAKDYQENLKVLEARLDQADRSIREKLKPLRGKAMFVFHPAWGYFADEYGLRQVAIQIEGKEPTDQELTELQVQARREGVKVIFVQPQFASGAAEAVARAIGARVEPLDDLAPDVIAGLLQTAEKLVQAYR
jgi:zinc transport system substrate-binding protein